MLDEAETSDAALVGRARDGDRDAFARLVERHYDFMHRVAWRWCGNRTEAEDIAQDVCVRMARAIRDYRGGGAFTTWLYALAMNAARDARRRGQREAAKVMSFAAEQPGEGDEQAAGEEDGPSARLWAAVRQLPDKQRESVILVYGEGLPHAAAADAMGISEATVSWHIHEAKKRLKVLVHRAEEE